MKFYPNLALIAILFAVGCSSSKKADPAPSSAQSYLPVTAGSHWTYSIPASSTYAETFTMLGSTTAFNNKTYYNYEITNNNTGIVSVDYFYSNNGVYSMRSSNITVEDIVDLPLGLDNEPVVYTWTTVPTDNGMLANSGGAKAINTIKEINITKTVNGKVYTDVMHTRVDLESDFNNAVQLY